MKKSCFLLLLAGILIFSVSDTFGGDRYYGAPRKSKSPQIPQELQNLPPVQALAPEPGSEVLDEVIIYVKPGGTGATIGYSKKLAPDEESGSYELNVDPVHGTYKATEDQPEDTEIEEIRQQMEMEQGYQQLNRFFPDRNRSFYYTAAVINWTRYAKIRTEDPINLALCQTSQRLYWNSLRKGTSYRYVWGANPTSAGTNWYNGGYNNYPLIVGDTYLTSRFWAWYYNWDFLFPNWWTVVAHEIYIYGFYDGSVQIAGYAGYDGECWWLLRSHVAWGL